MEKKRTMVSRVKAKVFGWYRRVASPRRSPEELHEYWIDPSEENRPEAYTKVDPRRTQFLVELFEGLEVPKDASILEIGCNAGRNLNGLWEAGWRNLHAVEISPSAIELFEATFPRAFHDTDVRVGKAEEVLPTLASRQYDVVYSMAVLVHIHRDNDRVLDEIARVVRWRLVTVEDEGAVSERHFRRSYRKEFERKRGFVQLAHQEDVPGMPAEYVARTFAVPATTG